MNGAELLVRTATACGIEICFANAGTTEIPIVMALDKTSGIKAILGLFEGVCTGAADGYGRMTGKPAMALLHLGPGFANGIANLHDARRARTPLLNVIGEHATWHLPNDPPLAMNIDALTRTVSGWVRTNTSIRTLSRDVTEAIHASGFGQIASLIVPHDHQLAEVPNTATGRTSFVFDPIDDRSIEKAARRFRSATKPALVLDGRALRKPGPGGCLPHQERGRLRPFCSIVFLVRRPRLRAARRAADSLFPGSRAGHAVRLRRGAVGGRA